MGGEGILNQLTAESGAGPGAKRSHGSVCFPRRKGGELNSFTLPGVLLLGQTPGGVLDGRGQVGQEPEARLCS